MRQLIASTEGQARAILRVILAFVLSLHGLHKVFGVFVLGGRRNNPPMALETLPHMVGYLELAGGILLLLGLFARPVAALLLAETIYAYFTAGLPHGILPMRNSSQESTIEGFVLLYFLFAGAGAWSLDELLRSKAQPDPQGARTVASVMDDWAPYVLSIVRIGIALLFFQHGLEKFFGLPSGRVGPPMPFLGQRWFSAVLEFGGGLLLASGLFSRVVSFILCGEMAVAYFVSWVPQGKWLPITGSEECVMFCFTFLWLVASGPGPVGLDSLLQSLHKKSDVAPSRAPVPT
jgi:putative oxidoreductase